MTVDVINLSDKTDDEWLELRHPFLGASETPVLTGDGYSGSTYWDLWRRKSNPYVSTDDEVSDRMQFGRDMQSVFGKWLARRKNWDMHERRCLVVDRKLRLSSTMDFTAHDPSRPEMGSGCIETKNRDFFIWKDRYTDDDAWIYDKIQLAQQMRLVNAKWGVVAVLVGGNEMKTYEYTAEQLKDQIDGIPDLAADFWRRVDQHDEPDIMYSDIRQWALDRGAVDQSEPWLEIDDELDKRLSEYGRAKVVLKDAKATKEEIEAALIQFMNKNRRGIGKLHTVKLTATEIGEKEISYVRKAYWKHTIKVDVRPGSAPDLADIPNKLTPLDAG